MVEQLTLEVKAFIFYFSRRRRHTRCGRDWSSDVCSSDLDEDRTVDLTFFVEPGKRTYVRNINFTGNDSTVDEVLRREMLQMEGGWASTDKIDMGKTRLDQRSEEHTSELQSRPHLVCRLLLEKK